MDSRVWLLAIPAGVVTLLFVYWAKTWAPNRHAILVCAVVLVLSIAGAGFMLLHTHECAPMETPPNYLPSDGFCSP